MPESFRSRSFRFALDILALYRSLLTQRDVPNHVSNQTLRAGTARGANLEEAVSASSRRDLIAKNAIALREARECHYWLRLVKADQPSLAIELDEVLDDCPQLVATLTAAVRKLRGHTTV